VIEYARKPDPTLSWTVRTVSVLVPAIIFAGVVLPRFLDRQGSHGPSAVTQVGSFKSAIELYMLDHHHQPPDTLDELVNGDRKYLTDISAIPKDPWGNDFHYEVPGPKGEPFLVTSWGADGKPGGANEWDADITSAQPPGDRK
jgi:general secretion pathway protein G